jgi:predicted nucleic acid-binding protein
MTYLLDVSTLLARLWESHVFHRRARDWMTGKKLAVCAITELGFLRISTTAFGAEMDKAREMLKEFLTKYDPQFIPCDIRALDGLKTSVGSKTADYYLANLAEKHGLQWATLDESVKHKAAFLLPV